MPQKTAVGLLAALGGISAVAFAYKVVITGVSTTTVALSLLLVVLAVASKYGLVASITASISGMLCFNFFFLPPYGTLTIEKTEDWVALLAFLITAVVASQLSSAARARASDAERRREEVMKLYQLSRSIIATPDSETAISSIARQVVEIFGFQYCAVFQPSNDGEWQRTAASGELSFTPSEQTISRVFQTGEIVVSGHDGEVEHDRGELALAATYSPLKMGVRSTGVMVLISSSLERSTAEAIAGLVALALERARFLIEVSRTEALRQSDELKAAILASVSHDLRTPLTAIRAAVDNLLQEEIEWGPPALREFHLIISEEVERLTKLIHNLLEMARIEAGELKISKRWESIAEVVYDVMDRWPGSLSNHKVTLDIEEDAPMVKIDSRLVAQALTNLAENAAKYSPSGSEIIVRAAVESGELRISVRDQGPGIAAAELDRVFDKFYRGADLAGRRIEGTGMGLAIARGMVEALGGRIWVESDQGRGATFTFAIPVETRAVRERAVATEEL